MVCLMIHEHGRGTWYGKVVVPGWWLMNPVKLHGMVVWYLIDEPDKSAGMVERCLVDEYGRGTYGTVEWQRVDEHAT